MAGQVIYRDKYFPREKDEKRIWRRLDDGSHVLLLAPRRVGKSSMLVNMQDRQAKRTGLSHGITVDRYVFLYCIVQSCTTEHEYYRTIIEQLFKSEFTTRLSKLRNWSRDKWDGLRGSISGLKLSEAGITFKDTDKKLTHQDLKTLLNNMSLEQRLVIIVDEFPDVVENVSKHSGQQGAQSLLAGCRTLWQDPVLSQKVQFIVTGSIGLDTLVKKLNLTNLINVLIPTTIKPLPLKQGGEFITFVQGAHPTLPLDETVKQYMLSKLEWLMPYYINLLLVALVDYCDEFDVDTPTTATVDCAFLTLFSQHNRIHFSHWEERLSRLEQDEARFAKRLLNVLAQAPTHQISLNEVHNLQQQPAFATVDGDYVFQCLIHDGYVFNDDAQQYRFTTPLLKQWWKNYVAG